VSPPHIDESLHRLASSFRLHSTMAGVTLRASVGGVDGLAIVDEVSSRARQETPHE
jgi:hypothetical protein